MSRKFSLAVIKAARARGSAETREELEALIEVVEAARAFIHHGNVSVLIGAGVMEVVHTNRRKENMRLRKVLTDALSRIEQ